MKDIPFVWTRTADVDTLQTLLTQTYKTQLAVSGAAVYVERPNWVDLLAPTEVDVSQWSEGRVFCPDLELRWTAAEEGYHLHLLTEQPNLAPGDGWRQVELAANQINDRMILLWGTHRRALPSSHRLYTKASEIPDEWIETRLPRPLEYPVDGQPSWVRIQVRDYQRDHITLLTRLRKMEGYNE